ncbi:MAG: TIGR03560 family F420-dependent LLM class oxidoreductase [Gammaproteobacteria bacterium]|nr:TIGR03560 family F420-dependent LLM class oxidoreductase [Gammaproteobacteria bacterium]
MKIGMHAGPQDLHIEELKRLWQTGDDNGFHWISVWDHFYANPLQNRNNPCFEGVAAMAGLAALTTNVRVGCLVFCALFRSPGMLAKSAVTVDHLSGGRAEIGIGAGWFEEEFREFGYGFPPLGKRLDQLEEALTIIRSLWHDEETNFKGEYYELQGAVCSPKPLNPNMRLWVGGRGKRRTPRLAAKYGDGFNMPYLPPDSVHDRLQRVRAECDLIARDPEEIETSVNVGFYMNSTREPDINPEGSLVGSTQQTVDRIGEYVDSGVGGLNIAFRPPVDWDALAAFIEEVMPVFALTRASTT